MTKGPASTVLQESEPSQMLYVERQAESAMQKELFDSKMKEKIGSGVQIEVYLHFRIRGEKTFVCLTINEWNET